jgi:hypothetical protein
MGGLDASYPTSILLSSKIELKSVSHSVSLVPKLCAHACMHSEVCEGQLSIKWSIEIAS